jgi:hypothetical protein
MKLFSLYYRLFRKPLTLLLRISWKYPDRLRTRNAVAVQRISTSATDSQETFGAEHGQTIAGEAL